MGCQSSLSPSQSGVVWLEETSIVNAFVEFNRILDKSLGATLILKFFILPLLFDILDGARGEVYALA